MRGFVTILLFLAVMAPAQAGYYEDGRFTVLLEMVPVGDPPLNVYKSCLLKEFRSLGDVDVIKTREGKDFDYHLMIVISEIYDAVSINAVYLTPVDKIFYELKSEMGGEPDPMLYTVPEIMGEYFLRSDIKEKCEVFVAGFDTRNLQPIRDFYESVKEKNKKREQRRKSN